MIISKPRTSFLTMVKNKTYSNAKFLNNSDLLLVEYRFSLSSHKPTFTRYSFFGDTPYTFKRVSRRKLCLITQTNAMLYAYYSFSECNSFVQLLCHFYTWYNYGQRVILIMERQTIILAILYSIYNYFRYLIP